MPLPVIKHCLICEDIRLERRFLNSFMGVYGATPDVGIRIHDIKSTVGFMCVFMGPPTQGTFTVQAELRDHNGSRLNAQVLPERSELTFSLEMGSSIFVFRFTATFPSEGTYTIVLLADEVEFFKDTFRVVQGTDADFA